MFVVVRLDGNLKEMPINTNSLFFSQACIIAFTSDFIQKSVYQYTSDADSPTYVQWSLSTFRTADFENSSAPNDTLEMDTFHDLDRLNHSCRFDFNF